MNQIRKFRKNKKVTEEKLNKLKSTSLKLALIMLNFIFATFAWFTYTIILNPAVDVNVSAWQVDFKDNDTVLGTSMQFQVGNFYPGMDDYTKQIEIINLGDRAANITYRIDKLKILGQEYQIKETAEEGDSKFTVYKSETINNATGVTTIKLLNDSTKYPFEIIVTHSATIDIKNDSNLEQNKGSFEIRFTWPYEVIVAEGETADAEQIEVKNALDTKWGYDIANFYETQQEGDTTQGIEITLQAIAEQII